MGGAGPAALLAQRVGLAGLVNQRVTLARHGAHGGTKTLTVLGSMLTGGPSINDTAVLRACTIGRLFDELRDHSTSQRNRPA